MYPAPASSVWQVRTARAEAVLGLCLGCEIYGVMVRRGWRAPDDALEICPNGACDLEMLDARHRERNDR